MADSSAKPRPVDPARVVLLLEWVVSDGPAEVAAVGALRAREAQADLAAGAVAARRERAEADGTSPSTIQCALPKA